jgi:hypothetical protein
MNLFLKEFPFAEIFTLSKREFLSTDQQSMTEEIEFSRLPTEPSEISSLTSFARKTAVD